MCRPGRPGFGRDAVGATASAPHATTIHVHANFIFISFLLPRWRRFALIRLSRLNVEGGKRLTAFPAVGKRFPKGLPMAIAMRHISCGGGRQERVGLCEDMTEPIFEVTALNRDGRLPGRNQCPLSRYDVRRHPPGPSRNFADASVVFVVL
jgi:hypothetical protein